VTVTDEERTSTGEDLLARRFDGQRGRLRAVAARMLGDGAEAEDAVQEAWFRLHRTDADSIDNLNGWLTTVVSRVCLDHLRSRASRREDAWAPVEEVAAGRPDDVPGPEHAAVEADAVGAALQVVLDTLAPAERLAFVLHDLFGVPFDEIAPIVERSPEATRQLASRARRRVRGGSPGDDARGVAESRARQRAVVEAFLAASREGRFEDLLQVLDPDVVLRADTVAVEAAAAAASFGAPLLAPELHGALAVATAFSGRAQGAQLALVDGVVGAVWAPGGRVRSVFAIDVRDGKVAAVGVHVDRDQVAAMDIELLTV
jgi:RNA polymerase sigma-70 factor (ECF subfamily)